MLILLISSLAKLRYLFAVRNMKWTWRKCSNYRFSGRINCTLCQTWYIFLNNNIRSSDATVCRGSNTNDWPLPAVSIILWLLGVLLLHNYYYYYYCGSAGLCWSLAAFSVSWSYTLSVRLLGRGISASQVLYLRTEQHKHRINAHNTDNHALSGIRTHDPRVRASEDSSCFRWRGHCDQPSTPLYRTNSVQGRKLSREI
jgi:hypothetical protein